MKKGTDAGINFFQRYLTIWVFLCMAAGVLLGHFAPVLPDLLARFEYARVSIPMAILIWVMIYPMMLKVDFQSIRNVGKNPKQILRQHRTIASAVFGESFEPEMRYFFLKYIKYSCEKIPFFELKISRRILLPNYAVLP